MAVDYGIAIRFDVSDAEKGAARVQDSLSKVGQASQASQKGVDALSAAFQNIGRSGSTDAFTKLAASQQAFSQGAAGLSKSVTDTTKAFGDHSNAASDVQRAHESATGSAEGFSASLSELAKAALVFVGVTSLASGLEKFSEEARQLNEALTKLQSSALLSAGQIETVRQRVTAMSAGTATSAKDMTAAIETMAKAGVNLQDAFKALPVAQDLAKSGSLEIAKAADVIAQTAGKGRVSIADLGQATDQLFVASRAVNGEIGKLGNVFGSIYPTLKGYGASLQEVVALSAMFVAKGSDGSAALKDLGKFLQDASRPAKEFRDKLGEAGVSASELSLKTHSLGDVLERAKKSGLELSGAFGAFGSKTGVDAYQKILDLLKQQADAVKRLKDAQGDSFGGLIDSATKLKNALIGIASDIGSGGGFSILSTVLRGATSALLAMAATARTLLPIFEGVGAAIATAFAPAAFSAFVSLLGQVGTLVKGLAVQIAAFAMANPFLAAIAGAVGLITALAALSSSITIEAQSGVTLGDVFVAVWERIKSTASSMISAVVGFFQDLYNKAAAVAEAIRDAFDKAFGWIERQYNKVANLFGSTPSLPALPQAQTGAAGAWQTTVEAPSIMDSARAAAADRIAKENAAIEAHNKLMATEKALQDMVTSSTLKAGEAHDKDAAAHAKKKDILQEELERLTDYKKAAERISAINTLFSQGKITIDQYTGRLQELRNELLKYDQSFMDGIQKGLNDVASGFTKFGDDLGKVVKKSFDGMSDAIVQFAETGKFNFRSLATSILADILKLSTNAIFGKIANALLGGMGGAKFGTGLGLGSLNLGSLFGFAEGGAFTVAGSGGTDSQLVAFKATPGERVSVATPSQQARGANAAPVYAAPNISVPVRIVNSVNPQETLTAVGSPAGEQLIFNMIQRNASSMRKILGVK